MCKTRSKRINGDYACSIIGYERRTDNPERPVTRKLLDRFGSSCYLLAAIAAGNGVDAERAERPIDGNVIAFLCSSRWSAVICWLLIR
ncbi:MAG: hypothetical protein ACC645_02855 [Pirellulales bacterium]